MTEETGAAAPATEQAVTAPAVTEQATPTEGVSTENAAPENAETQANENEAKPEGDRPRLTRNQRLQRKAARLSTMVAEQAARIEELERKSATPDADLPKPSDYAQGEYDPGYLSDLAAHKAASKFGARLIEQEKRSATDRINERRQEAAEDFLERAEQIKSQIPDYDQTFETFWNSNGRFAPHVVEELHDSEHGPMLAYQLAKNPQLASQLNAMSARDAAREIGRLEAKVSLPQPKRQTQAPAPIAAIKGGAAATSDVNILAKQNDISAFVKMRNEQDAAKRR